MKIPFLKQKSDLNLNDISFLENLKVEDNISKESFFKSLGYLIRNFKLGNITKITAEQMIIELVSIVAQNKNIPSIDRNRFFLVLFQELKQIQKSKQSKEIIIINGIKLNNLLLKKLTLSNIYFIGCIFDETDLSDSIFKDCEFRGCSFVEADLSKVRFIKNKFIGCDFEGAVLDKTKGL